MIVSKARQTRLMEELSKSWVDMVVQSGPEDKRQPNLPKCIDQQQVRRVVRWHYLNTEQVACRVSARTVHNVTCAYQSVCRLHFVPSQPGL